MNPSQSKSDHSKPIVFIDPSTGETYNVKPAKATVDAAWKCGFIPFTGEDHERSDAIDRHAMSQAALDEEQRA